MRRSRGGDGLVDGEEITVVAWQIEVEAPFFLFFSNQRRGRRAEGEACYIPCYLRKDEEESTLRERRRRGGKRPKEGKRTGQAWLTPRIHELKPSCPDAASILGPLWW